MRTSSNRVRCQGAHASESYLCIAQISFGFPSGQRYRNHDGGAEAASSSWTFPP